MAAKDYSVLSINAFEARRRIRTLVHPSIGNEDLVDDLQKAQDAKEFTSVAPLTLMDDLETIDGLDMDALPDPYSIKLTGNEVWVGKFKVPNAGGGEELIDFYVEWAKLFPKGAEAWKVLDLISQVNKAGDSGPAEYRPPKMSHRDRKAEKKLQNSRLNGMASALRKAVDLHHKLQKAEQLPGVIVEVVRKRNGKDTTYPIVVTDKADPAMYMNYAVGAFLGLDPDKALEAGGTFEAFIETNKRDGEEDNEEEARAGTISKDNVGLELFVNLADWTDTESHVALIRTKANTKGDEGETQLHALWRLWTRLDPMFTSNSKAGKALQARAEAIERKLADGPSTDLEDEDDEAAAG